MVLRFYTIKNRLNIQNPYNFIQLKLLLLQEYSVKISSITLCSEEELRRKNVENATTINTERLRLHIGNALYNKGLSIIYCNLTSSRSRDYL